MDDESDGDEYEVCELVVIKDDYNPKKGKHDDTGNMAMDLDELHRLKIKENKEFNITSKDFPLICRTCLNNGSELLPITDDMPATHSPLMEQDHIRIDLLLKECANIEVNENDGLPKKICAVCLKKLIKLNNFRKQCCLNESILNLVLTTPSDDFEEPKLNLPDNIKTDPDYKDNVSEGYPSSDEDNKDTASEGYRSSNESDDDADNCETTEEPERLLGIKIEDVGKDSTVETSQKRKRKLIKSSKTERSSQENRSIKIKKANGYIYKCHSCESTFDTYEEFRVHRREAKHPVLRKLHSCPYCKKQFTSGKFTQHLRSHTKEKPFKCKVCPQAFTISGNLRRHEKIHTGEKPHICEICGKAFIQSNTLRTHKKTHTNYGSPDNSLHRFLCAICGRGFQRFTAFERHKRKHDSKNPGSESAATLDTKLTVEKPYACEECGKCFKTTHLLKAHKATHGERSFLCSDCGKGFVTKAALLTHLRTHTGEKPHTCRICNKSFSHATTFDTHILTHTGQKPHACHICGKTFTQISHVKYHLRTHSGERPYVCSYCGKTFALKGNLTVHVRTHTGETPFSCDLCGKGFYDSSSRNKHQRSHEVKVEKSDIDNAISNDNVVSNDNILCEVNTGKRKFVIEKFEKPHQSFQGNNSNFLYEINDGNQRFVIEKYQAPEPSLRETIEGAVFEDEDFKMPKFFRTHIR